MGSDSAFGERNWEKGIPINSFIDSAVLAVWEQNNPKLTREQLKDIVTEVLFEKYRREGLI